MEARIKASRVLDPVPAATRSPKRSKHTDPIVVQAGDIVEAVSPKGLRPESPMEHRYRTELIMLLEQALCGLGFHGVAQSLSRESGISHETPLVTDLRGCVLQGQYSQALAALEKLSLRDREAVQQMKFLVLEEHYLETIGKADYAAALGILQRGMGALGIWKDRIEALTSCLLCRNEADIQKLVAWPGTQDNLNRKELMNRIQVLMPPDLMMPESRLESLLRQGVAFPHRTAATNTRFSYMPNTLLADGDLAQNQIPTCTTQILEDHADEVWHLQFSPNGRYLATASADKTAIIYIVQDDGVLVKLHQLQGHDKQLTFCCWSHDSSRLATCSLDSTVRIYDVYKGNLVARVTSHSAPVITAAWSPNGDYLYTSGEDKMLYKNPINESAEDARWVTDGFNDLIAFPDGSILATISTENKVGVWRKGELVQQSWADLLAADRSIVSTSTSQDGSHVALNMADRSLNLWRKIESEDSKSEFVLVRRLKPPAEQNSRYIVRSCFGGQDDLFVASGSEECKVFVWHTLTGNLLASLEGHSGAVNAVSWNPSNPHMLASASDDCSVHIWTQDLEAAHLPGVPAQARIKAPIKPSTA